jgi:hypothetical protein
VAGTLVTYYSACYLFPHACRRSAIVTQAAISWLFIGFVIRVILGGALFAETAGSHHNWRLESSRLAIVCPAPQAHLEGLPHRHCRRRPQRESTNNAIESNRINLIVLVGLR